MDAADQNFSVNTLVKVSQLKHAYMFAKIIRSKAKGLARWLTG